MTISNSTVNLSSIQTEYGGSNPISLHEYYRGGTYVPASTAAGVRGVQISTSSAINMSQFLGTQKLTADVSVSPNGGKYIVGSNRSGGTISHSFTASPSGIGPFLYSWTRVDNQFFTASGTNTATLTLSKNYFKSDSYEIIETWKITVTDQGNGNTSSTSTISVEYDVESNLT